MRRTAMLFVSVAAAGGLLWLTCNKSPTSSGDGGIGPTSVTYNYTATSTEITVSIPAETYSWCNFNDVLVTYTSPAQDLILPYYLSGDTLGLVTGNDTVAFIRSGSGSGLTGTWSPVDPEETEFIQVVITATTVTVTTYDCEYADDFIDDWNWGGASADSATYAVTVEMISCSQVRLTGLTTGEVVYVTWNASGDATYSSATDAGHAAGTVYENPTSCPNEPPAWYESGFLGANYKTVPAAKKARKPAGPRLKRNPLLG